MSDDPHEPGAGSDYRPRQHDHLVEPMLGALHGPPDGAERPQAVQHSIDCAFHVADWQEHVIREGAGGRKLANASVLYEYTRGLVGTGRVEYLMTYTGEGCATFVGREWIECELEGKRGAFAVEQMGTFDKGTARSRWAVVEGSATGELAGLSGSGEYASTSPSVSLRIELFLPAPPAPPPPAQ